MTFNKNTAFVSCTARTGEAMRDQLLEDEQAEHERFLREWETCSVCKTKRLQFLKGEYFLCEDCYPIVKGLYNKADIERAIQLNNSTSQR